MSRKMKNFKKVESNNSRAIELKQNASSVRSLLHQNPKTLTSTIQEFNKAITAYLKGLD
ncbi:MAG: hypothetical protein KA450_01340 [Bacteroidia bacterium]|nr:hypothetical protein [Bacteroidia bacterium]